MPAILTGDANPPGTLRARPRRPFRTRRRPSPRAPGGRTSRRVPPPGRGRERERAAVGGEDLGAERQAEAAPAAGGGGERQGGLPHRVLVHARVRGRGRGGAAAVRRRAPRATRDLLRRASRPRPRSSGGSGGPAGSARGRRRPRPERASPRTRNGTARRDGLEERRPRRRLRRRARDAARAPRSPRGSARGGGRARRSSRGCPRGGPRGAARRAARRAEWTRELTGASELFTSWLTTRMTFRHASSSWRRTSAVSVSTTTSRCRCVLRWKRADDEPPGLLLASAAPRAGTVASAAARGARRAARGAGASTSASGEAHEAPAAREQPARGARSRRRRGPARSGGGSPSGAPWSTRVEEELALEDLAALACGGRRPSGCRAPTSSPSSSSRALGEPEAEVVLLEAPDAVAIPRRRVAATGRQAQDAPPIAAARPAASASATPSASGRPRRDEERARSATARSAAPKAGRGEPALEAEGVGARAQSLGRRSSVMPSLSILR